LTKNTKTDRAGIDREYAQVRKQNYATCWDEMEIGLGAIAVPISLPDAASSMRRVGGASSIIHREAIASATGSQATRTCWDAR
jgi:DNA-binding IclR family transcriptional regulator